jgi:hypothetical protein
MSGARDPLAREAAPAMPAAGGMAIDANGVACPAPIPEVERVILGHGSGGQLSAALMRDVIGPALAVAAPGGPLNDAAVVEVAGARLAFTRSQAATSVSWPSTARSTTSR